jgi:FtsH-binding integral membrane protein
LPLSKPWHFFGAAATAFSQVSTIFVASDLVVFHVVAIIVIVVILVLRNQPRPSPVAVVVVVVTSLVDCCFQLVLSITLGAGFLQVSRTFATDQV